MHNEQTLLLAAMQEAGEIIEKIQRTDFAVDIKSNNDIVTKADLAANEILKAMVSKHFPADGWLSEETADDLTRLTAKRVWIVDPIDGTREYAKRIPEYAISVALVEEGNPILAAVYNPAKQELFHACKGAGAWLNGERIQCKQHVSASYTLLASRSEYKRGEWEQYASQHEVQQVGSIAYKLGLIAAGRADATFSLGPKSEWDIAAGVLLVNEAGGVVEDRHQKAFLFNQENILVQGVVASSVGAYAGLRKMLSERVVLRR